MKKMTKKDFDDLFYYACKECRSDSHKKWCSRYVEKQECKFQTKESPCEDCQNGTCNRDVYENGMCYLCFKNCQPPVNKEEWKQFIKNLIKQNFNPNDVVADVLIAWISQKKKEWEQEAYKKGEDK